MSFVGPRPERPHFVDRLSARLPFYQERLAVKPGLTGWAQVNLPATASEAEARRKLEFDLYYVKSCGPLLDLLILLQTLRAIVWPEPAEI
jgi:lipopolysaccharide/colanic/teichoic acid biosynthesis glycosyltransferase